VVSLEAENLSLKSSRNHCLQNSEGYEGQLAVLIEQIKIKDIDVEALQDLIDCLVVRQWTSSGYEGGRSRRDAVVSISGFEEKIISSNFWILPLFKLLFGVWRRKGSSRVLLKWGRC